MTFDGRSVVPGARLTRSTTRPVGAGGRIRPASSAARSDACSSAMSSARRAISSWRRRWWRRRRRRRRRWSLGALPLAARDAGAGRERAAHGVGAPRPAEAAKRLPWHPVASVRGSTGWLTAARPTVEADALPAGLIVAVAGRCLPDPTRGCEGRTGSRRAPHASNW